MDYHALGRQYLFPFKWLKRALLKKLTYDNEQIDNISEQYLVYIQKRNLIDELSTKQAVAFNQNENINMKPYTCDVTWRLCIRS